MNELVNRLEEAGLEVLFVWYDDLNSRTCFLIGFDLWAFLQADGLVELAFGVSSFTLIYWWPVYGDEEVIEIGGDATTLLSVDEAVKKARRICS